MTQDELKKFEPFWNKWYLVERLGGGSFGDVYQIKREEYGAVYYSALKVVSIPRDKAEFNEVSLSCGTKEQTKTYFDNIRQTIVDEIGIMERFKGKNNIVSYEDHDIIPKNRGLDPGYDIFIRMELLEDVRTVAAKNPGLFQDNREAVRLGKDVCEALRLCHNQKIIHRDIKPGNIFRSQDGDYKLGDFGISKKLLDNQMTLSIKGTFDYMAPEVYNREHYDFRADIYSLGMVLYHLLNGFRGPFLDGVEGIPSVEQKERALILRMQGQAFENPKYASERLSEVILKACAFRAENRYNDIQELKDALTKLKEEDLLCITEKSVENDREKKQTLKIEIEEQNQENDRTIALIGTEEEHYAVSFLQKIEEDLTEQFIAPVEEKKLSTIAHSEEKKKEEEHSKKKIETISQNKKLHYVFCVGGLAIIVAVVAFVVINLNRNDEKVISDGKCDVVQLEQKREGKKVDSQQSEEMVSIDGKQEAEPIIPVLAKAIQIKEKKVKDRYPEGVYVGDNFSDIKISGKFQVSETNNTKVKGKLQLNEKGKIKKSGDYTWTFIPEDQKTYETVRGTIHITALIEKTITGTEEVRKIDDKLSLRDVDLSNSNLSDLTILEGAKNLTYLQLDNNDIKDLNALRECKKLKFISLNENKNLSDITVLFKLKYLDAVFLDGTAVSEKDIERMKQ